MTRVLLIHSGHSMSTHDVYFGMLAGLKMNGVDVVVHRLDYHITAAREWVKFCQEREGVTEPVLQSDVFYQAAKGAVIRAVETMPDAIIQISGLMIERRGYQILDRLGIPMLVVGTENPYEDELSGCRLPYIDVMTVNDRVSLEPLRTIAAAHGGRCRIEYMPLGYAPEVHHPGVGNELPNIPAHDVVFVGTGFPERIKFLEAIDWTGIDFALYGSWEGLAEDSPLRPHLRGDITGNPYVAAMYDRAKVTLNLFRTDVWREGGIEQRPGGTAISPRLIEAAAIGACVASEWRPEVPDFGGNTIATFTTPAECEAVLRRLLADEGERAAMRAAIVERAVGYSYHERAATVLGLLGLEGAGIDRQAAVA